MEYQSFSSESSVIVTGDSEQGSGQGNIFVTVQVINELREKINNLQFELQHLKGRETAPTTDLLFQEDLNKFRSGTNVCSNAMKITNDLIKTCNKKNTEMSSELKALKGERNNYFDEEKDPGKYRNELLDFLCQGMGKLENRTNQLSNEIKNVRDGLKREHEQLKATSNAMQSIKDFLNNSDKRITETSNEVKALKEYIINGLLVRTETFDDVSFVKNEDLAELRNGIPNIYSKEIQQVHEKSKQQGKEIKDVQEGLKKQQVKVESVVKSTISIKNQCKDTNGKQMIIENSINQCLNEIRKLRLELKAEQQKNIILENKLITLECYLEEILLRNDMKQNTNKERDIRTMPVTKRCSERSDVLTETCISTMPDSKVNNNKPSQMDMPLKFLTQDFTWMDITPKDPDSVGFNEEAKYKSVGEGINQPDNKEQESMDFLLQKEETYEQESSTSSVCSQTDELNENECVDLAFDSTAGKDGALSYLEKAQVYLQNLQGPEMFTFSDEESLAESDEESSTVSDIEKLETFVPGNDTKKRMCSLTYMSPFFFALEFLTYISPSSAPVIPHYFTFSFFCNLSINLTKTKVVNIFKKFYAATKT